MSDNRFLSFLDLSNNLLPNSDAESVKAIREIANAESRSVAQVAWVALLQYALQSEEVQSALRATKGDEEAVRQLVNHIAQVVRAERFDAAACRVAQSLPYSVSVPEDEDAILAMAVNAVDEMKAHP